MFGLFAIISKAGGVLYVVRSNHVVGEKISKPPMDQISFRFNNLWQHSKSLVFVVSYTYTKFEQGSRCFAIDYNPE